MSKAAKTGSWAGCMRRIYLPAGLPDALARKRVASGESSESRDLGLGAACHGNSSAPKPYTRPGRQNCHRCKVKTRAPAMHESA
ncbi:hypothetical protein XAP6164_1620023 [Xanthomonas phaseoli pv. phaseoli]|nr:hypothetical protein XAP6164_1620023 [Xanthomonas phaseoli pv. phaseoli]